MDKSLAFLIAFSLFRLTVQELTPDQACSTHNGTSRGIQLSANSRRNKTGDWVDIFTARAESSNSSDRMNLDVTHKVVECQGKRVIYIQGVSQANPREFFHEEKELDDKLTFHPRCGKNAGILGNGRIAQKINLDDPYNGVVFTNRPLKDNEIFEIKLDKKVSKFGHSIGIGIITRNPTDIEILPEMYKSPTVWIYHNGNIYTNGVTTVKNYGKDINLLQVGDRVGVMRNRFGTIQFFVNGVDQGPAVSSMPSEVYGVFELWGNAAKATIVDASSPPSS